MTDLCTLKGMMWGAQFGYSKCSGKTVRCLWCLTYVCEYHQEYVGESVFAFSRCHKCIAENAEKELSFLGTVESARQGLDSSIIAFYEDIYLLRTKAARSV